MPYDLTSMWNLKENKNKAHQCREQSHGLQMWEEGWAKWVMGAKGAEVQCPLWSVLPREQPATCTCHIEDQDKIYKSGTRRRREQKGGWQGLEEKRRDGVTGRKLPVRSGMSPVDVMFSMVIISNGHTPERC